MLRALGFESDVQLYVASGEVYGGDETLASLKALFPNLHSKEALANKRELAPFSSSSSPMVAPDFIVCDGGDVFFYQQQWKLNMPKILAGQRYLCIFFSLVLCILVYSKAIPRTFQAGEDLFLLKIFTSSCFWFQVVQMALPISSCKYRLLPICGYLSRSWS